jgi:hypothetical protein
MALNLKNWSERIRSVSSNQFGSTIALALCLVIVGAAASAGFQHRNQIGVSNPSQSNKQVSLSTKVLLVQTDKEFDVPVADFNAPEPTNLAERAARHLRSKRHNLRDKSVTPENRGQFILREDEFSPRLPQTGDKKSTTTQQPVRRDVKHDYDSPVIGGAVTDESPSEQPLPTQISDAVVVGNVTDAKAYLSEDKTAVYSEFTVHVWDVLKNSQVLPFEVGTSVTVLRPGGGVRFPSGKVRRFLVAGRGLPHTGGRYAFFLKYDDLAQAYYIVTAYELLGGKVFPLDGVPQYGTSTHPFASYRRYANADEGAFLVEVRSAVIQPPATTSGFPISPIDTPKK